MPVAHHRQLPGINPGCAELARLVDADHAGGIGFLTGAIGGLVLQEIIAWIKSGAYKQVGFKDFFMEMLKNWFKRGGKK